MLRIKDVVRERMDAWRSWVVRKQSYRAI